ncbi:CHAT domain-containing protein [Pacificimonas sp. WHA3]|uniref:CHAT domain-containing protein n=1 Tax=Pacificimonas pallii TaxID=2827236 RepID=A0ABS6SBN3_9SPHN|nr:CHAT domain-containing tetratricopeptide repeat protein [Pacificimonas pallii]MBV7255784.1 CHAT domain-containing protein [Pacificimonas pallii]
MRLFAVLLAAIMSAVISVPALAAPTAEQTVRLEALKAAADAIDPAAETERNYAAWEAALAYAKSIYPYDHPEVVNVDAELAIPEYYRGDVEAAIARTERSVEALSLHLPEYRAALISSQNALVVFYMKTGRTADAVNMADAVLAQRRAQHTAAPDDPTAMKQLGAALLNAANAANEVGAYERSVSLIDEAVTIAPRLKGTVPGAIQWYAMRPIYLDRAGQPERAFRAALEAVEAGKAMLPERHQFQALLNNTLGGLAAKRGLLADAEAAQRRAVDIMQDVGPERQETYSYQATLAGTLIARGKPEEALALLESVIPPLEDQLGPEADNVLLAKRHLGEAHLAIGNLEAARTSARAVLDVHEAINEAAHRDRLAASSLLARIEERAGDPAAAYAAYHPAQEARRAVFPEENADRIAGEVRLGQLAAAAGVGDPRWALAAADRLAALRHELAASGQLAGESLAEIDEGLVWALEAALLTNDPQDVFTAAARLLPTRADRAVRAAALRMELGPAARAELRVVQDRREERLRLSRMYLSELANGASPARLAELNGRISALRADDADAVAAGLATEDALPTLTAVQNSLTSGEALLLAVPARDHTAIVLVQPDNVVVRASPLAACDVAVLVADARAALGVDGAARGVLANMPGSAAAFNFQPVSALHDALLGGNIAHALEDVRHLRIAASGALSRLPFAMLAPRPASGTLSDADWLIRHRSLSTVVSLSALPAAAGPAETRAGRVVAVGAPNFSGLTPGGQAVLLRSAGASRLEDLPPLPAAAAELAAIATAISARDTVLLTADGADEASVSAALTPPADVIAFATHGLLEGEIAGLSEPALALSPSAGGDGFLTASEIAALDMDAAWVILSACNTGGPDRTDAAGLTGLASSFLYAGARNLLVSHWQVADDVAADLTVPTVRGAVTGDRDAAEALRQAMLALIDSGDARKAHPALWAPFVHVGTGSRTYTR